MSNRVTEENWQETVAQRFREEVRDAKELVDFAVSAWPAIKGPDAPAVSGKLVRDIKDAEDLVKEGQYPNAAERTKFELSYQSLCGLVAPVTISSLRATSDTHGRPLTVLTWGRTRAEAKIWSRKLWIISGIFILIALFGENLQRILSGFFPADEEAQGSYLGMELLTWQIIDGVFQSLVPFTYGGIGACASLLRSCHTLIHKRQFNPDRIPEYYNRILLGIVSGGSIGLFIEGLSTDDGTVINLSAAAIGFLAGYNMDFLFNTIERVVAAIIPKVGLETVRRAPPPPPPPPPSPPPPPPSGLTVEDIKKIMEDASPAEKKAYQKLIDRAK